MDINLSDQQQAELVNDVRHELQTLKDLGDSLKNEVEQAHTFADLRMGISKDFARVQAGLDLFLGLVEQLDGIREDYTGSMADHEEFKILRRAHGRAMNHVIHKALTADPAETQAVARLLELYRYA